MISFSCLHSVTQCCPSGLVFPPGHPSSISVIPAIHFIRLALVQDVLGEEDEDRERGKGGLSQPTKGHSSEGTDLYGSYEPGLWGRAVWALPYLRGMGNVLCIK